MNAAHNTYTTTYSYDKLSRLLSADYHAGVAGQNDWFDVSNITYDKNGNLLSLRRKAQSSGYIDNLTYSYSGSNRLASVSDAAAATSEAWDAEDATFGYDANGNMTSQSGKITRILYDERNLPLHTKLTNGAELSAHYDGAGMRILKELKGGSWEFHLRDADRTLAVIRNGTLSYFNLYGHSMFGQLETPNGVLSLSSNPTYFLKDHLGSIRETVDVSGNTLSTYDYYMYGLIMPGRSSNSANPNDTYKFTGHEFDDEANIGLMYAGARYQDPVIGRWLTVDPLSDQFPGWTPYHYVHNNPLNLTDPTGMSAESCCLINTIAHYMLPSVNAFHYINATKNGNQESKRIIVGQLKTIQTVNNAVGTAASFGLAPTATLVGSGAELIFSGDDANIAGASARGAIADVLTEAAPDGGTVQSMVIGGLAEITGGFADRAITQEQTDLTDVISDGVGGAVGSFAGNSAGQRASAILGKKLTAKSIGGSVTSTSESLYTKTVNWVSGLFNREKSEELEITKEIK